MAFKIVFLACLVAAACAQTQYPYYASPTPYAAQPAALPYRVARPYSAYEAQEEEYGPAQYEFQYEVNDPETSDIKSQQETRSGNTLQGTYSFIQPDGLRRIVEYGDQGAGFIANVRYEPSGITFNQAPQYRYAYAGAPGAALPAQYASVAPVYQK